MIPKDKIQCFFESLLRRNKLNSQQIIKYTNYLLCPKVINHSQFKLLKVETETNRLQKLKKLNIIFLDIDDEQVLILMFEAICNDFKSEFDTFLYDPIRYYTILNK